MNIDAVSDASGAAVNEDLVAMYRHGAVVDLLIFDGASSVSERHYFDDEVADPACFVPRAVARRKDMSRHIVSIQKGIRRENMCPGINFVSLKTIAYSVSRQR